MGFIALCKGEGNLWKDDALLDFLDKTMTKGDLIVTFGILGGPNKLNWNLRDQKCN